MKRNSDDSPKGNIVELENNVYKHVAAEPQRIRKR